MNETTQYHVAKDGQTLGPYTEELIAQCLKEGRLTQADFVLNPEKQEWVTIASATFLKFNAKPSLPPLPVSQSIPPAPMPLGLAEKKQNEAAQATTKSPLDSSNVTNYKNVPWFRRAGILNLFSVLGLGLFFLVSPLLAFLVLFFPTIIILSGNVFTKKTNPDGTLIKWNWNFKLGPVVLCGLALAATVFLVIAGISTVEKAETMNNAQQIALTKAEVSALEAALESFKADNGDYPHSDKYSNVGLASNSLYGVLSNNNGKAHFDFPQKMTNASGIVDPFGKVYGYAYPGSAKRGGPGFYDLWSTAGTSDSPADEQKWIKNW